MPVQPLPEWRRTSKFRLWVSGGGVVLAQKRQLHPSKPKIRGLNRSSLRCQLPTCGTDQSIIDVHLLDHSALPPGMALPAPFPPLTKAGPRVSAESGYPVLRWDLGDQLLDVRDARRPSDRSICCGRVTQSTMFPACGVTQGPRRSEAAYASGLQYMSWNGWLGRMAQSGCWKVVVTASRPVSAQ